MYVADYGNDGVQKFTPQGEFVMIIGRHGSQPGELNRPSCLAIDYMDNVCVSESENKRVSVFTSNRDFLYYFREGQPLLWSLAIDEGGHLYTEKTLWSY